MKWILIFALSIWALAGSVAFSSETVKGAKKDFAVFKQEMNVKLNSLNRDITRLREEARVKGGEARQKTVAELEQARDKVRADLAELEKKSEGSWRKFKRRMANSLDRLNSRAQKMLSED